MELGRGREVWQEEAREEALEEAAKNFNPLGLPLNKIAAATGLDPEVIQTL
jgi:predicted transposase YdaD